MDSQKRKHAGAEDDSPQSKKVPKETQVQRANDAPLSDDVGSEGSPGPGPDFDEASMSCDGCGTQDFNGIIFSCLNCDDFDLCAVCNEKGIESGDHKKSHEMQQVELDELDGVLDPRVLNEVESAFKTAVESYLPPIRTKLVAELKKYISLDIPDSVETIFFEVQPEDFSKEFPVVPRALGIETDQSNEVFGPLFAQGVVGPLLKDVPNVIPLADWNKLVAEYQPQQVDVLLIAGETFSEWFAKCWDEAGGEEFALPVLIAIQEDNKMYDLRAQQWFLQDVDGDDDDDGEDGGEAPGVNGVAYDCDDGEDGD